MLRGWELNGKKELARWTGGSPLAPSMLHSSLLWPSPQMVSSGIWPKGDTRTREERKLGHWFSYSSLLSPYDWAFADSETVGPHNYSSWWGGSPALALVPRGSNCFSPLYSLDFSPFLVVALSQRTHLFLHYSLCINRFGVNSASRWNLNQYSLCKYRDRTFHAEGASLFYRQNEEDDN